GSVGTGEVIVGDAPIPRPALELVGNTGGIVAAAFSPDSSRLATGSYDKTVKVWDTRTGAALLDLKGHTGPVEHVAFSADGTRILSSDDTHDDPLSIGVKVWDAKTGSALLELKGKPGEINMGAFSPDGTRIVTGRSRAEGKGRKGGATVWDAKTGTALVEVNGLPDNVLSVAFSPDGTRFFTVLFRGPAKVWDASTGKEVPGAAIPDLNRNERTSPDGRLFAHVDHLTTRVELVSLKPDAEELAYRRLHMQPNVRRYRAGYLAARAARDDFAAAFYLNLTPPGERKGVVEQAEADALAALSNLAAEHERAGNLEETVPLYIEILNYHKAKLGPEDPATIQTAELLGQIYYGMGQFEKAIPLFEDVLKARRAKFGREDPATRSAMSTLGWTYKDAGRLKEAIAVLEEVAAK